MTIPVEERKPILEYETKDVKWGGDFGYPDGNVMFVVKQGDKVRMVDFRCPCGCGHCVPTHVTEEPHNKTDLVWIYSNTGAGPSLYPSIRWTGGCKAHFNIEFGKVKFHGDSGK